MKKSTMDLDQLLASAAKAATPPPMPRKIWEIRTEEQLYAKLSDTTIPASNRYGQKIDLIELTEGKLPVGRSMFINENPAVGSNPNRNKQHGFFFTADNCIGCHACEAACSEKNDNPAHLAFRSVGYVEGGSFPDYKRMNISMACNHCDDPVCLKGCPTRAYTKHTEYGAVLQDPETCFGCGYCTWVCPYNAPQLDPVKGQVSKCNMCVDRLEVGLKPACVSACVGNALDFGVIENIPAGREHARVEIPGFPSPEITKPNIRFQQIKQLPDEMKRTDSMPVKYHKDDKGRYRPAIDQKKGQAKHWNLARLSSRENPLVLFTLAAQAAAGAFALQFIGALVGVDGFTTFAQSAVYAPLAIFNLVLVAFGLFMSTMHLGKPKRFYRGFNNLRHSPVSREGLGIAIFIGALGLHILASLPANSLFQGLWRGVFGTEVGTLIGAGAAQRLATVFGGLALLGSVAGLYYMNRCYRIKARPFWNHWQVGTAFVGSALSLGALLAGAVTIATLAFSGHGVETAALVFGGVLALGLAIEGLGHLAHARAMGRAEHEGGASYYIQTTTFGKTFMLRNALLGLNVLLACGLLSTMMLQHASGPVTLLGWAVVGAIALVTSLVGRALFYVLVIPTTMPGAFFWKNKAFEEHARDIGLANLPQVGVAPLRHYP
ncbi:DmsC/YnfH family molybdoenzyme membrane anchor subunit [Aquabacterium sp.]|uniref:DmsC/YnfH family molybdoenzyme membrane anchor subunit n=1 Tax=Aquabacterium sp. TaxID=1872578 RepID=UPI002BB7DCEE|nr:DmsC/YnfH family molybdoenzyme membrane anchor subunit [Aquabacterium sp.]HSW06734.1 DmsC/YnfH family molybdoenzyme membrane anchor subunit [Aquabacterium sp.]